MKKTAAILVLIWLGLFACGARAAPFDRLYVLGDSLSDSGNVSFLTGGAIPGSPYYQGRFSNGPNYADQLAVRLGLPLLPSFLGGTNYAIGGARTYTHASGNPNLSILAEAGRLVTSTPSLDANALYIVFGGANDIQDAIVASNTDPAAGQAMTLTAAANIRDIVAQLAAHGARSFLVPNTPSLAYVPRISQLGSPQTATELALLFNSSLENDLNGLETTLGIDIARLDSFRWLADMVIHGPAYGFSKVTDPCYTGDDLQFTGGGTVCADPSGYLFFDTIHPTTRAHAILAARALTALRLPEPATLLLMAAGLAAIALARGVRPERAA